MSCVYILKNKINGKCYVGQTTKTFKHRLHNHLKKSKVDKDYLIGKAIKKYGIDSFETEVIHCLEEDLDKLERNYIEKLNSLAPNGYNLETGGNKQKRLAEETKQKISKNNGKGMLGKHQSDDAKKKLSEANSGEKSYWWGKHHSDKTKKKLSD